MIHALVSSQNGESKEGRMRRIVIVLLAASVLSCGGGKYGFDVKYRPLKAEKKYFKSATQINYEEIRRDPLKYADATVGWFGVVDEVLGDQGGKLTLLLSYRTHQDRHLCEDKFEKKTCRVTVSKKSPGTFMTTLEPSDEADMIGKNKISTKSLIKVYGKATGEYDENGGPVIETMWFRHWPPGQYVDTSAASFMRQ
jgi:hypothetical protein